MENISLTMRKGFQTWTHNLNICIPFFLNFFLEMFVFIGILVILITLLILPSMPSLPANPDSIEPEMIIDILSTSFYDNIFLMGIIILFSVILIMVIGSYFQAGAIGMAKKASETGTSTIGDMFISGKESFINIFLIKFILFLMMLAGIVFVLPGLLSIGDINSFLANPDDAVSGKPLLTMGVFIWLLYLVIIGLVFIYSEYAVVVEKLDPVGALGKGFSVFMQNKFDTLLLWLSIISISILLGIIGQMMVTTRLLSILWFFVEFIISFAVIQPLTTVWWTRMFLRRTGREVYDIDDYLRYP